LRAAEYRDAYGKITKLGDDFEKIDKHYHEIFIKRHERLAEKFVFDFNFKGQLEILARSPYAPISTNGIELLLQLADAACIIGREEVAIAVLEFLASRPELSETQRETVKALRDRIQVTVRFHYLRDKAAKFDDVKKQTDAIIAQAFGDQLPEPGV
jgi:hypothetical protein